MSKKKGLNLTILRQIWLNFRFKKVIYWLGPGADGENFGGGHN